MKEHRRDRDRKRWLALRGGQVLDRIYECELEEAHLVSLRKWGPGIRLTAWRYASPELRQAAVRVPITYPDGLDPLQAHFERPRVMAAGGGGR
jgi:hypothetical protein